ncbi:MAG: helix-turn-helix domain-containing protein [Bacteroidota bacterium]
MICYIITLQTQPQSGESCRAKERLFNVDKSVSEVAHELGFKYPQHFSRLFKKRVGMAPNVFRNRS